MSKHLEEINFGRREVQRLMGSVMETLEGGSVILDIRAYTEWILMFGSVSGWRRGIRDCTKVSLVDSY